MGNEAKCVAWIDGKRHEGKALLETSELIFRGAECRVKITFSEMKNVTAADGKLRVGTRDGETVFEVGAVAAKWCEKILHPKTRIEKLGVKPGMRVSLLGHVGVEFADEVRKSKAETVSGLAVSDAALAFVFVEDKRRLSEAAKVARELRGAAGLWVVYPKGKKEITENDVLSAGRRAGLKDVKVVGFSPTHTALKFVIPVENR